MELSEFEQSVLRLRAQFYQIRAMVPPDPASDGRIAQLAFDQLYEALEELQVAQEELRAQNEQLETASEETQQAEARYQDLFEFAPDGYLVTDENGTILQANRTALELLKASLELVVGKPLLVFIENKDHKKFFSLLFDLAVGTGIYDFRTRLTRMDKTSFEAAIRIASPPASRGKQPHLYWLVRDISYRRQLEDELREANRELNARVKERTRELKEQLDWREKAERESIENATRLEVQHRLIDQSEKERQRISRDLHDGPLQDLIGITFGLQELALDATDPDLAAKLQELRDSLHNQINHLRNFAGELRPPALVKFGLESAIRSHLENLGEKHPEIQTHLEASLPGNELSETTRLALYRIYQAAVTNILLHAGATEIRVTLARDPSQIELTIQDNGCGFTPPARLTDLARAGHLGIAGMLERAEAVNGSLQLISQPGQGTTTRVLVPIEK